LRTRNGQIISALFTNRKMPNNMYNKHGRKNMFNHIGNCITFIKINFLNKNELKVDTGDNYL
jgi:hypothetical protein